MPDGVLLEHVLCEEARGMSSRGKEGGPSLRQRLWRVLGPKNLCVAAVVQVADPRELLRTLRKLHYEENLALEAVIPLLTSQPAARLQLPNKGSVSALEYPCATSYELNAISACQIVAVSTETLAQKCGCGIIPQQSGMHY